MRKFLKVGVVKTPEFNNREINDMDRVPVVSTDLAEIGYDSSSMTLEVLFLKGGLYQYFDVPESIFLELLQADSKGRFLNINIKNNYRYTRL